MLLVLRVFWTNQWTKCVWLAFKIFIFMYLLQLLKRDCLAGLSPLMREAFPVCTVLFIKSLAFLH